MFKSYSRVYFELLVAGIALIMGMSLSSAFLPIFAYELDPSALLVGFVTSAWFISRIFTELPSGVLSDRFGRRTLLVVGLAFSAIGAFLCSTANVIHVLILGRAIWGSGTGLFFMSSSAAIFDLFKSEMRGRALGTFQGLEFIGSFIGAPIGGLMVQYVGYNGVFLFASALILLSFLVAFFSKGLKKLGARSSGRGLVSLKDILPGRNRWDLKAIYINSFFRMFVMQGITTTVLPLYLSFGLGMEIEMIGLIVSARTIGVIAATVTSGYLSDMFGRKKTVVLGIVTQIICYCFYLIVRSFEFFLALGVLEGLGNGIVLTALIVLLSDSVSPKLRGGAIGMYRTFMDFGGLVGPIFFAFIFYSLEPYLTFVSAICILCLNVAIAILAKNSPRFRDETLDS